MLSSLQAKLDSIGAQCEQKQQESQRKKNWCDRGDKFLNVGSVLTGIIPIGAAVYHAYQNANLYSLLWLVGIPGATVMAGNLFRLCYPLAHHLFISQKLGSDYRSLGRYVGRLRETLSGNDPETQRRLIAEVEDIKDAIEDGQFVEGQLALRTGDPLTLVRARGLAIAPGNSVEKPDTIVIEK